MGFLTRAEYNELVDKLKKRTADLNLAPYPSLSQVVRAQRGEGPLSLVEKNIGRVIKHVLTEVKPSDPIDAVIISNHLLDRVVRVGVDPTTAFKKMRSLLNLVEARKECIALMKRKD